MPQKQLKLKVKKLHKDAKIPAKAFPEDAGFDLYSFARMTIPGPGQIIMPTKLAIAIPDGHFGKIWDRSGVASRSSLTVVAGVVDATYRGEIGVVIANYGDSPITIEAGQRIAQIVIQPLPNIIVTEVTELEDTTRNTDGFGSTGSN